MTLPRCLWRCPYEPGFISPLSSSHLNSGFISILKSATQKSYLALCVMNSHLPHGCSVFHSKNCSGKRQTEVFTVEWEFRASNPSHYQPHILELCCCCWQLHTPWDAVQSIAFCRWQMFCRYFLWKTLLVELSCEILEKQKNCYFVYEQRECNKWIRFVKKKKKIGGDWILSWKIIFFVANFGSNYQFYHEEKQLASKHHQVSYSPLSLSCCGKHALPSHCAQETTPQSFLVLHVLGPPEPNDLWYTKVRYSMITCLWSLTKRLMILP